MPARKVVGYVRDDSTDRPLEYRLNGPLVLALLVLLWVAVGGAGVLSWDWLYDHRWSGLVGSCVLGLLFSLAMVLPARSTGRSFLADLYFGRLENRQFFHARMDAKMFLYLVGAAMLGLNLLSFTAHHVLTFGSSFSPGVLLYCILFFWFVVDYLVFERVHLYTYDIFAERVGFKLGFGCLTFYPYFYLVGLWVAADLPDPGTPPWLLVIFAIVFFVGWTLSRGANMQKYFFKTDPERALLGFVEPRALSDGQQYASLQWILGDRPTCELSRGNPDGGRADSDPRLSRPLDHLALSSVLRGSTWHRERADERRCAAKYGVLWEEYVRLVPRRIIPWLY